MQQRWLGFGGSAYSHDFCQAIQVSSEWMSKTCSLTETDLKLNPDSFKINEFNHHDFICEFIYRNSAMNSQYSS